MTAETLEIDAGLATRQWPAIGTTAHVVVRSRTDIDAATRIVVTELDALDRACSRFRVDSEIATLSRAGGAWVAVSGALSAILASALEVASFTDGDVDPTMGADLQNLGYDRDFGELVQLPAFAPLSMPLSMPLTYRVVRQPSWRDVELDEANRRVRVPAGVVIDLGAIAKAWCADRCAGRVASELGAGVLVSLGGDIATAGIGPRDGWVVRVQDKPDSTDGPSCAVVLHDGFAVATSSTVTRTWQRGASRLHHILDPATRLPAEPTWRTVTVAARSCVRANAASTAAIVRGRRAPRWLGGLALAARLVSVDGVVSTIGGWPTEHAA
ncbi:MAG TPA: FAD:protein FMN transferase [Acidothermaceae bacterium]